MLDSYLAGALVDEVKRIPGELDTAVLLALGREGVVVSYASAKRFSNPGAFRGGLIAGSLRCPHRVELTDNLPDEVRGDVGERSGRHLDCGREFGVLVKGRVKLSGDEVDLKFFSSDNSATHWLDSTTHNQKCGLA